MELNSIDKNIDIYGVPFDKVSQMYNERVEIYIQEIDMLKQKRKSYKEQVESLTGQKYKIDEKVQEQENILENNRNKINFLETEPEYVEYNKIVSRIKFFTRKSKKTNRWKLRIIGEILIEDERKN